jgi:hypothetical protein
MAININNGVQNIKSTPGMIADDYANIPAASNVANGTLFVDTVGLNIYRAQSGGWFVLGGGGGGSIGINGLNGTTNIGLGGTLLNDTAIDCSNFELTYSNIKQLFLLSTNGTMFSLVDNQSYFSNSNGIPYGLIIDFAAEVTTLGDFSITNNGTSIQIDDANSIISAVKNTIQNGLKLDFVNDNYYFGDFYNLNNFLNINNLIGDTLIKALHNITLYQYSAGLILQNGQSILCDPDGNGNSSYFGLDDTNERLTASSNLISATAGGNSGQHLKINIGGNNYKITLLNP